MKGIILAGGSGTRLYPLTKSISKQMLPVYDKPMIYYPLSVLMLSGIKEILIISTPKDLPLFENLLGNGSALGISIQYKIQYEPKGLAEAFIIGEEFIGNDSVCLILGDNIFHGKSLEVILEKCSKIRDGATVFGYWIENPTGFGVIDFNENFEIIEIQEKPDKPKSNYIVPGLYFYDNNVVEIAKSVKPSTRNELEITCINNEYLKFKELRVEILDADVVWYDTGTCDNLKKASDYIYDIQKDNEIYIGCIEEIAFKMGYIDKIQLLQLAEVLRKTSYGNYLLKCANIYNL